MSDEPNSDAVDILSELESDNQNIPETPKEQNLVESEKAEPDNSAPDFNILVLAEL